MTLDNASDLSWFGQLNTNAALTIIAVVPWVVILILWRGSARLGIVGIGTTIKSDLDYVVHLLEHVMGKPPTREAERVSSANEAKSAPKS